MFHYGKSAANSMAVLIYLASAQVRGRCASREISDACKLSLSLTSKLLNRLSSSGLVRGQPGPGGGYALARPPEEITLLQIASLVKPIG